MIFCISIPTSPSKPSPTPESRSRAVHGGHPSCTLHARAGIRPRHRTGWALTGDAAFRAPGPGDGPLQTAGYHIRRLFASAIPGPQGRCGSARFHPGAEQFGHRDVERIRQLHQILQRRIPQRTFNARQICPVHFSLFRQPFLRPAFLMPKFAQSFCEGAFRLECRSQTPMVGFCRL